MENDKRVARLQSLMKSKGVKGGSGLGRFAGIPAATARAYLNKGRPLTLDACLIFGRSFNVEPMWIFEGDFPLTKARDLSPNQINASQALKLRSNMGVRLIPIFGASIAGQDGRFALSDAIVEQVAPPTSLAEVEGAYAVYVIGDTMEPRYEAGEKAFVHPSKPVRPRDYVVLRIHPASDGDKDEGYLKRLVSISDEYVIVEQFNPPKRLKFPIARLKSIHKVVLAGEG